MTTKQKQRENQRERNQLLSDLLGRTDRSSPVSWEEVDLLIEQLYYWKKACAEQVRRKQSGRQAMIEYYTKKLEEMKTAYNG